MQGDTNPGGNLHNPLLELRGVSREFAAGDQMLVVLKEVNLSIHAGEMLAIVGQSGSGKSTLMNILGCLDRPTSGSYRVDGRETGQFEPDELAQLRREHFGFVFQRYHLLSDLTAQGNVEVPAVYSGRTRAQRHERSTALLSRLGMADRMHHTPGKLSGGQQQRVSIARALMNGGRIILADEPTGALDTKSGVQVMEILKELHSEGHTVIIVTHDMSVASHAQRVIEIRDGVIVSDKRHERVPRSNSGAGLPASRAPAGLLAHLTGFSDRFREAFGMALLAMNAHRLRTFLTMLGIVIGIASVVSVVALGAGTQKKVLSDISAIGTNTIEVYSGSGFGDVRAAAVRTLIPADADALAAQPYVDSVTPNLNTAARFRWRNIELTGTVNGVGEQYFRVKAVQMSHGTVFDAKAVQERQQVAVIDDNTHAKLFPSVSNPVGEVVLLGSVPVRVIGVTAKSDSAFGTSEALNIWVPYTTAMRRIIGQNHLRSITVRVADTAPIEAAEQGIHQLLKSRHGREDFYVYNTDGIRKAIETTTRALTLLVASIAVISLMVGGIGVMNIMLVSVTERTREIGVRIAVGARQGDIQQQFLIEAVLVCLVGGTLGIAIALTLGALLTSVAPVVPLAFSISSMVWAFACSTLIGVVFGFMPARSAARLNPIDALARD